MFHVRCFVRLGSRIKHVWRAHAYHAYSATCIHRYRVLFTYVAHLVFWRWRARKKLWRTLNFKAIKTEETPGRKRKQSRGKLRKWNDEETDLLIDLLEQNACLWDVFSKDYHLKDKRDKTFETMQEELGISIADIKYKITDWAEIAARSWSGQDKPKEIMTRSRRKL